MRSQVASEKHVHVSTTDAPLVRWRIIGSSMGGLPACHFGATTVHNSAPFEDGAAFRTTRLLLLKFPIKSHSRLKLCVRRFRFCGCTDKCALSISLKGEFSMPINVFEFPRSIEMLRIVENARCLPCRLARAGAMRTADILLNCGRNVFALCDA